MLSAEGAAVIIGAGIAIGLRATASGSYYISTATIWISMIFLVFAIYLYFIVAGTIFTSTSVGSSAPVITVYHVRA